MSNKFTSDVVVVGGGPAGLAAAIAAQARGLKATVFEIAQPPIDKACGEGIMPDGLAALSSLGVTLDRAQGAAFQGIRFVDAAGAVQSDFAEGHGIAMRRPVLHAALIERAREAGVEVRWNTRVASICGTNVSTASGDWKAKYLVGADGLNSSVRRSAALDGETSLRRRIGFRRHYNIDPWSRFVEVHWSDCGQMYVTPVSSSQICVAFITHDKDFRFDEALTHFPFLHEKLHALVPVTSTRGSLTLTRRLRRVQAGHVALIGDASGSADAITGDGLSMSFRQALVLADAMANESLPAYGSAHRNICRLPIFMGELMLTMSDHPGFRQRVFRVFDRHPEYFGRLLAMHTGQVSPWSFIFGDSLSLGWRLLTAESNL